MNISYMLLIIIPISNDVVIKTVLPYIFTVFLVAKPLER